MDLFLIWKKNNKLIEQLGHTAEYIVDVKTYCIVSMTTNRGGGGGGGGVDSKKVNYKPHHINQASYHDTWVWWVEIGARSLCFKTS